MSVLKFDLKNAEKFVSEAEVLALQPEIDAAHATLINGTGEGSDFTGWVDWHLNYDKEEYERVKAAAAHIRANSEYLIVIGIGGSYLGARAAIEMLTPSFGGTGTKVLFAGCNLSASYLADMLELIDGHDVSLNVISKSGTTTEPAIAFRILREHMEKKYGKEEAAKRIYATTDKARGALHGVAVSEGYETFVVPDNIGGRYSVLTPVGLLPIAVAGLDTDAMLKGAAAAGAEYSATTSISENACYRYAAVRNALYRSGKTTEIMVNYEPSLHYVTEWWKQLYGESEGKDGKGIFPAGCDFTTDLHSMGQYIQDGRRNLFETALLIEEPRKSFNVPFEESDFDGLNYLAGMDMNEVNRRACQGTVMAHVDGGVPNLAVILPKQDEFSFGAMVYFFERACGISGYMLGVNPFNQPGVEAYKKNMFALLGKPGYTL